MAIASVCVSRMSSSYLPTSAEGSAGSASCLTQASFKLLPLYWNSEHVSFFCMSRVESLFLQPLAVSFASSSSPHSQMFWGYHLPGARPQLRSPMWGSELSFLRENLCSCDYRPVCVLPTRVSTASLCLLPFCCGSLVILLVMEDIFASV